MDYRDEFEAFFGFVRDGILGFCNLERICAMLVFYATRSFGMALHESSGWILGHLELSDEDTACPSFFYF